jgi:hypothetical protein
MREEGRGMGQRDEGRRKMGQLFRKMGHLLRKMDYVREMPKRNEGEEWKEG